MARADSLIKKVDAALKKAGPMSRNVYKRTITTTGDSLIGRVTTSLTDTLLSPQPVYRQLGRREAVILSGASQQFTADDYKFTLSVNSITEAELEQNNVQFVLKDSSGATETIKILWFNSDSMTGKDVVITVIGRSVAHG